MGTSCYVVGNVSGCVVWVMTRSAVLEQAGTMHECEVRRLCDDDFLSFFTYTEMSTLLWRRYPLRKFVPYAFSSF